MGTILILGVIGFLKEISVGLVVKYVYEQYIKPNLSK